MQQDRHARLRELPFLTVIEALGFSASDFKTRKNGHEWAEKCPIQRPKRNSTSFCYSTEGKFQCFSCSAKGTATASASATSAATSGKSRRRSLNIASHRDCRSPWSSGDLSN
jgi:hypothetical protein